MELTKKWKFCSEEKYDSYHNKVWGNVFAIKYDGDWGNVFAIKYDGEIKI
jgi:hypothetical protein